jgi:hypothetical protein
LQKKALKAKKQVDELESKEEALALMSIFTEEEKADLKEFKDEV